MRFECLRDRTPYFSQILFAVLGEERCKRRLFREGTSLVVVWFERVDFPLWSETGQEGIPRSTSAGSHCQERVRVRDNRR